MYTQHKLITLVKGYAYPILCTIYTVYTIVYIASRDIVKCSQLKCFKLTKLTPHGQGKASHTTKAVVSRAL